MSRRDTIIVAVLINTGLLIVLFASALKPSMPSQEYAAQVFPSPQEIAPPPMKKEVVQVAGDEVDHALNQYVMQSAAPSAPQFENSFASDLNAITLPEVSAVNDFSPPPPIAAAAMPAPIPTPSQSQVTEVKVKKGDVLEKIARHHHTTVAELMKLNKLTTTNLRIGQTLKIPGGGAPVAYVAESPKSAEKFYIVKKGDNPWTIAVKNHMKVEELLKLNHMNEDQARRLKPGDQLRIQ